jgi:epoxide hydrolase 4
MDTVDELVRHRRLQVGGLGMHVAEAGEGPLVVLLHGFPDHWYGWRRQIPALVAAGYRVLAPDLRGYADTDAPRGVAAYGMRQLVGDVAGLVTAAGVERASLVGHDWGGVIAWTAAGAHPERFDRLAICNAPHPAAFEQALRSSSQLLRSWYTYAFQLPVLPELALGADDGRLLRQVLRSGATRRDSFTDADLDRYVDALLRRGDLTGPLHYYRAAGRAALRRIAGAKGTPGASVVHQPVLVQWGDRDLALVRSLAEPPRDLVPDARVVHHPDAGHWVQLDEADAVNTELLRFLAA